MVSSPRIFLAGGDAAVLHWLSDSLHGAGYQVTQAADPEAALSLFRQSAPEVVLLDDAPPLFDGIDVCGRIKAVAEGRHVPVVLMVGAAPESPRTERALAAGADELATKPIQWPILRHRLALLLRSAGLEQRLQEQQLKLQDARLLAESANRARSAFLDAVNHDLRAPLDRIQGMAEALAGRVAMPEDRLQVNAIRGLVDTLLARVHAVVDLFETESERSTPDRVAFDLRRTVEGAADLFRELAQGKGVRFFTRIADGSPAAPVGDPTRLRRILTHLLANAVKFTQAGGEVTLVVEGARQVGDVQWVRFVIRDTGIGISPEQFDGIFKSLALGEVSMARRPGGDAGLGLIHTKRLIKLLGGYLHVDSAVDVGSVFAVELPFAYAMAADNASGPRHGAVVPWGDFAPRPRLLLVDDDTVSRAIVRGILKRHDLMIDEAGDGQDALDKLAAIPYDLVLMDCQMPRMDGYTACRLFREYERKQREHGRTPVIALTANAMQGDRERCLACGMDDHLAKPIRGEDLRALLTLWLGSVARAPDLGR